VIRARGKSFQIVVYAGRVDGKDAYVNRTAPTYREAKALERKLADEVAQGRLVGGARTTMEQLLERWLKHARPNLAATTARMYRSYSTRLIIPELGTVKLAKLTPAMLDDFYAGLLERGYEPATVRQVHAIIRRALSVALRWGWIVVNPAASADPPRVTRSTAPPPDPSTVRAFLASIDDDLATILRVMATCGLRRGELCALRWSDLDLDLAVMVVSRSFAVAGGKPIEKDTKTHQQRALAIDAGTVAALRRHLGAEQEKASFATVAFDPAGFVFTTEPNRAWHPDALGGRYRRVARSKWTQGKPPRLHDWRHFSATQALAAGIPVRQVSARLGHASAAMTLDVYGHAIAPADRAAADALGALLDSP